MHDLCTHIFVEYFHALLDVTSVRPHASRGKERKWGKKKGNKMGEKMVLISQIVVRYISPQNVQEFAPRLVIYSKQREVIAFPSIVSHD